MTDKNRAMLNGSEVDPKLIKHLYIILGVMTVFYYVIPCVVGAVFGGTEEGAKVVPGVLILVLYMTAFVAFMVCLVNTGTYKVSWWMPILIALFFIPSAVIFYCPLLGSSMILFSLVFAAFGYFGELTGWLFKRRRNSRRQPVGLNTLNRVQRRNLEQSRNKGKKGKR